MSSTPPVSRPNPLFLRDEEIRQGIELLFFAQRDFGAATDPVLDQLGLGRAHARVIHFVGRRPDLTVNELLAILKITKQSLGRVLSTLVNDHLISQTRGIQDRRQRLLRLTDKGIALEHRLSSLQRARLAQAYREAGAEAVAGFRKVLTGLIAERDSAAILAALEHN